MLHRLDRLHAWARRRPALEHFTAFTRILLAVGFLPPGLKKVLGMPFTSLGPEHPVGLFFDVFQRAELWYAFVGWGQVVAAVLLLFPRTATLGAVLYFPIILNIAVITTAIGFQGTVVIAWLMTLACLYLLCWDYDRLSGILPVPSGAGRRPDTRLLLRYPALFGGAGLAGFGVLASLRVANLHRAGVVEALVMTAASAMVGLAVARHLQGMSAPDAPAPTTLVAEPGGP